MARKHFFLPSGIFSALSSNSRRLPKKIKTKSLINQPAFFKLKPIFFRCVRWVVRAETDKFRSSRRLSAWVEARLGNRDRRRRRRNRRRSGCFGREETETEDQEKTIFPSSRRQLKPKPRPKTPIPSAVLKVRKRTDDVTIKLWKGERRRIERVSEKVSEREGKR